MRDKLHYVNSQTVPRFTLFTKALCYKTCLLMVGVVYAKRGYEIICQPLVLT